MLVQERVSGAVGLAVLQVEGWVEEEHVRLVACWGYGEKEQGVGWDTGFLTGLGQGVSCDTLMLVLGLVWLPTVLLGQFLPLKHRRARRSPIC